MRAASDDPEICQCLVSFVDVIWAIAEADKTVTQVLIAHAFKGKGKDPHAIASYRPLGLAGPLLALLVDVLLLVQFYYGILPCLRVNSLEDKCKPALDQRLVCNLETIIDQVFLRLWDHHILCSLLFYELFNY